MSGALASMSDSRSFMSASLPAQHNQALHQHSHSYHARDDNAHLVSSYTHAVDADTHKRSSTSSYGPDRHHYTTARPPAQAYGSAEPPQLPSLNGAFQDPTRSLYGPGMGNGAGLSGGYGGPTQTDENGIDTFRLPVTSSTPSPHSPHDYQHQPDQLHQDSHGSYSQASYHDQLVRRNYHSDGSASNIASSSSPSPTHSQPRQHHPLTQMLPSMLYTTAHPDDASGPAFSRSFATSAAYGYAHSRSSSSLSPQSATTRKLPSTPATSNDDRAIPASSQPSARPQAKRREKPKIELSADQPLTTQGKPRARVYVACLQCRTRKIRCDGSKPVCHNCSRRVTTATSPQGASSSDPSDNLNSVLPGSPLSPGGSDSLGPCCYDSAPKRRGPDKNPGSRQRISHAQRELELLNSTVEGGKVKRRRRRDAAAAANTPGIPGAAPHSSNSASRVQQAVPFDNNFPSALPGDTIVHSSVAGVVDGDLPTHGAAHSPVGAAMANLSTNIGTCSPVAPVSAGQPISAARDSEHGEPQLHLPPAHTAHDYGQQAIANSSSVTGVMGSPELYRSLAAQGQRAGAHAVAPPHSMSLSHAREVNTSEEGRRAMHGDRHLGLQSTGNHRFSVSESSYPALPVRVQIQVPSQAQHARHEQRGLSRMISPAQEYPPHHSAVLHSHLPPPHGPPHSHLANALNYASYQQLSPPHLHASISPVDDYDYEDENIGQPRKAEIGAEPSVQFTRETWWDTLLGLYSQHSRPQPHGRHLASQHLTPGLRDSLAQQITADLKFLFRSSNYWFAFVNVPHFFSRLLDTTQRSRLQPAFILAALACANLTRSSEQEEGREGREWALQLLERAQASLEASVNSRWIDESLVAASWFIAFFEVSAHPLHNTMRVRGALIMLDNLVRTLSIAGLDSNDQRTSIWGVRAVPTVPSPPPSRNGNWTSGLPPVSALASAAPSLSPTSKFALVGPRTGTPSTDLSATSTSPGCPCGSLTLGRNWAHAQDLTPLWLMTPAWNTDCSEAEHRKEECRRVVWSAVTLVAGYTNFVASMNTVPTMDLFLMEPSNIALLFPGETLAMSSSSPNTSISPIQTKHTVWALYMRTLLLWHSCLRMRWDTNQPDARKAEFAMTAWLEIDKIEKALDTHTCNIERAFLFAGREYLFNARMCISFEFQRFIPQATANANLSFHRRKAEDWLTHQASVAKRTMYGLQAITGQPNVTFARRPFFCFWFMSQVSRALLLWSCDNTLTIALDVSKALLGPIEYLMSMWPCADQQRRYRELRANLDHACLVAGVAPPSVSDTHPARPPAVHS